jgi:hypothetical protein
MQLNGHKGGLVTGITIFSVGLVFLMDNLGIVDISILWPLIPMALGVGMLIKYLRSEK